MLSSCDQDGFKQARNMSACNKVKFQVQERFQFLLIKVTQEEVDAGEKRAYHIFAVDLYKSLAHQTQ